MKVDGVRASGAANGYANINIGHDAAGNRASGSIISNLVSKDALGWGITVVGSTDVKINGYKVTNAVTRGIRVYSNSDEVVLSGGTVDTCQGTGVIFESGTANKIVGSTIKDNAGNGVSVINGAHVDIDETTVLDGNCTSVTAGTANLQVVNSTARISGTIKDSLVDGIICSGSTAYVDVMGARVSGNAGTNFNLSSGGDFNYSKVRLGTDPLNGTFTTTSATVTVTNDNALDPNGIVVMPRDSAARSLNYHISAVSAGTSFTVNFASTPAGTEVFSYMFT